MANCAEPVGRDLVVLVIYGANNTTGTTRLIPFHRASEEELTRYPRSCQGMDLLVGPADEWRWLLPTCEQSFECQGGHGEHARVYRMVFNSLVPGVYLIRAVARDKNEGEETVQQTAFRVD